MTGVVIIGAGGHGRETYAALLSYMRHADSVGGQAAAFLGFIDDHEPDGDLLGRLGVRWLGPTDELRNLPKDTKYLIGIGSGRTRQAVDRVVTDIGLKPFTLVDPDASVGPDVRLAPGAVVFARATVTTNIEVGRHAHIGRGVALGHDSVVGDYASIYPNASVSGNVVVGKCATVGTGAAIRQAVSIAPETMVGAGAVVISDVRGTVVGVPAR